MGKRPEFSDLVGKTIVAITGLEPGSEAIDLFTSAGDQFRMYHIQDCCETVQVEDVCGDVSDLIGRTITLAEESTSNDRPSDIPAPDYEDSSQTWTFYRLWTDRGMVTIRWYGSSNGYYSESVYFDQVEVAKATGESHG